MADIHRAAGSHRGAAGTHLVEAVDSQLVAVVDSHPEAAVVGNHLVAVVDSHPVAAVVGNHLVAVVDSHPEAAVVADSSPAEGVVDRSLTLPVTGLLLRW
jgi:hypothetical protein